MKVDRNPTKPNALGKSNMQKTSSTYLNSRFSETRITPPPKICSNFTQAYQPRSKK